MLRFFCMRSISITCCQKSIQIKYEVIFVRYVKNIMLPRQLRKALCTCLFLTRPQTTIYSLLFVICSHVLKGAGCSTSTQVKTLLGYLVFSALLRGLSKIRSESRILWQTRKPQDLRRVQTYHKLCDIIYGRPYWTIHVTILDWFSPQFLHMAGVARLFNVWSK